jgi:ribulose-5-phosphate 4-epimerase/fuculose-1-phosphate aldolase
MSAGYFTHRSKLHLSSLQQGLITANHILHNHGVLDADSHISVRNPDAPKETFFLSYALAPALVSSQDDIVEYKIADAEAAEKSNEAKEGYEERFVHSEIYKKFPDVNCVVHSHAHEVIPFGIGQVPLKPVSLNSGFLGK